MTILMDQYIKSNSLLWLHVGICGLQFPAVLQVLELDPALVYPELHENVALVSTVYLPFTTD